MTMDHRIMYLPFLNAEETIYTKNFFHEKSLSWIERNIIRFYDRSNDFSCCPRRKPDFFSVENVAESEIFLFFFLCGVFTFISINISSCMASLGVNLRHDFRSILLYIRQGYFSVTRFIISTILAVSFNFVFVVFLIAERYSLVIPISLSYFLRFFCICEAIKFVFCKLFISIQELQIFSFEFYIFFAFIVSFAFLNVFSIYMNKTVKIRGLKYFFVCFMNTFISDSYKDFFVNCLVLSICSAIAFRILYFGIKKRLRKFI